MTIDKNEARREAGTSAGPEIHNNLAKTNMPQASRFGNAKNLLADKAAMSRDFVSEALEPVGNDSEAALCCLSNADDRGARYHLARVVSCVRAAAAEFRALEALTAGGAQ